MTLLILTLSKYLRIQMNKTKIQWCDYSWNPVTGCTPISEGCKKCYARKIAMRFEGNFDIKFHPERLEQPLKVKKPSIIFVGSMCDLFHDEVKTEWITSIMVDVIHKSPQHIFLMLTKRPARMKSVMENWMVENRQNLWLGVSCENQKTADERIPILLQIPAFKKFVSVEPILEEIDILYYLNGCPQKIKEREYITHEMAIDGGNHQLEGMLYQDEEWVQTIPPPNWIVCGAESGIGKRPCKIEWVRDLKNQCVDTGVPFFYKQGLDDNGNFCSMPVLDGQEWKEMPNGINS